MCRDTWATLPCHHPSGCFSSTWPAPSTAHAQFGASSAPKNTPGKCFATFAPMRCFPVGCGLLSLLDFFAFLRIGAFTPAPSTLSEVTIRNNGQKIYNSVDN